MSTVHVRGVPKGAPEAELEKAVRQVFLSATEDLAWLKPGDTVLLKPAVNSPDPYPATAHPLAVKVTAEECLKRGAKVVVGDQSGIGHVMHTPHGVTKGSTLKNFEVSGVTNLVGPEVRRVAFEQEDWERDFFLYTSETAKHWPNGFYMTNWIRNVDHIVNLPRLSTHSMAGVTLGFKNLVGLMREDSRIEFHTQGPFFDFMKAWAKKENFKLDYPRVGDFFEKITEVALAVKDRLRCTLFVGTQAQLTMGPDKVSYRLLGKALESLAATPEVGVVFASADPVVAEATAIAAMAEMYRGVPWRHRSFQKILMAMNGMAKELGTYNPWDNPFVAHALKLGLGERKAGFSADGLSDEMVLNIKKRLD